MGMDKNVFFSTHEPGPLGRCWQTASRESFYAIGVVWTSADSYCPHFPRANPTNWDQLLSLGEEGLHQDVHCWNYARIWVFIFSEHMRFAGCFAHKQDVKLRARQRALAMHPEPRRPSALQSWTTRGRMKLSKAKLFCGKPLPASPCPLLQWDAGRLCRQAGSLSSRSHSYAWAHGAWKLSQVWHQATVQWQNTAVILLPPSAFSPNTYFAFAEV